MSTPIGKKIKDLCGMKGISMAQLAEHLGKTKQAIYEIVDKEDLNTSIIRKVAELLEIDPAYFLMDSIALDLNKAQIHEVFHSKAYDRLDRTGVVPLYDIEAAANLNTLTTEGAQDLIGTIRIPNLPKCDGAVYVRGDSMYPLLKSGDIVVFKIVEPRLENILFGEMYLVQLCIDNDPYLVVKYVNRSDRGDQWVKLVSYNEHHTPKDVPVQSLQSIALVKLTIRYNTML
ncbi:MAG: XRE family transcriptional regulator [Bacteroidales bacterium]|nr:XRE family transcriptional regulator [Bacteroidales bacterium]